MGKGEASVKCLGTAGLPGEAGKDVGCAQGLLASSTLPPCPVAVLPDTGAGAASALTICSATGCHRGGSQRAPL